MRVSWSSGTGRRSRVLPDVHVGDWPFARSPSGMSMSQMPTFEPRNASSRRAVGTAQPPPPACRRRGSRPGTRTPIAPMAPRSSMIEAPQSSIGTSRPSRARSAVWLASPTRVPRRSTLAAGSSTGCRVSRGRCERPRPAAARRRPLSGQPSALLPTGFRKVTRSPVVGGDDRVADARERDRVAALAGRDAAAVSRIQPSSPLHDRADQQEQPDARPSPW